MALAKLLARLDDDTLEQYFSHSAIDRGRRYLPRVRRLELAGNTLSAQVQGSERLPYHTSVRLARREYYGEASIEIATRCTCPVGHRCKHAVAVLLAAQRADGLVERPREAVMHWAATLPQRIAAEKPRATRKAVRATRDAIVYLLECAPDAGRASLALAKTRLDPDGHFSGDGEPWIKHEQALLKPPAYVNEEDLQVFRLLRAAQRKAGTGTHSPLPLAGPEGAAVLQAALATGRCYAIRNDDETCVPLIEGNARKARLHWQPETEIVRPRLHTEPAATVALPTAPLWYIDTARGEAGRAQARDEEALRAVLELPALTRTELPVVAAALAHVAPELPSPLAANTEPLPLIDTAPRPLLHLDTMPTWQILPHRGYPHTVHGAYDFAQAFFAYGEAVIPAGADVAIVALPDGRSVRLARRPEAEREAMRTLAEAGFEPVKARWLGAYEPVPQDALGLASETAWQRFFADTAPALREAGWHIDCAPDFRHHVLIVDAWHADLTETEAGWFELSLGIEVDGRRIDLAPLLHALFRQDARWLESGQLDRIPDDERITLHDASGARILVQAGRIKPLARTLVDLFDKADGGARAVSRLDAPRIAEALGADWQREGWQQLDGWLARIGEAREVRPVAAPEGFGAALRPYQLEGLAWLQHLREHELGGILADDMGLGKTAQTLAHLLTEKRAGRLDRPVLVVLPTSLVFNWRREAERFAPELSILTLHGKERKDAFARIPEHDVCLTTYPLLWRDREDLGAHGYHSLILDEAQTVKNAGSQAARVVRELSARHRLCLTGTPLENHLGELWSQFDFLLPGFLGDAKSFTKYWRTPIEKHGDQLRRDLLARRVAPFILRRRKEDVAKELPPKTIVVKNIELAGRQRDLYETVRASMDKRIREEIAARGFARSQIVILDALLKLRQVCCDPRLLKTTAAAAVKERAKLDLLMEMLPELVDEGRKVLVFSQFTEMLGLIEAELAARGIAHVKLTGQTKKRAEAVEAFQEGDIPVFLISLKAGGVGLNLTAADTVIHFDPWWNPAAENQATDRAHRIGQDKPVFVFKLVCAGSIEERILALQDKKSALAAGVLSEDAGALAKFGESELAALFAPLPE